MARTADLLQRPRPDARCRLRDGSCPDGEGMPSAFRSTAMRCRPAPSIHSRKMRATTGAATASIVEAAQLLSVCGLARVRVRAGVDEHVAVRRATAEEPALGCGLRRHRGPHSDLDAVALALAHAAVEAHDEVVGVGARIDRSADLGDPQSDPVVDEDGEGEAELVAVERALRLTDDDRVEAAPRVLETRRAATRLRGDASTARTSRGRCRRTPRRPFRRRARSAARHGAAASCAMRRGPAGPRC